MTISERWIASLTGGLLLVGIAQALLFWWQLRLIRKSLIDTERAVEAAEKGALAAEHSADMAKATIATMQDTARRQLRAYLCAEVGSFVDQNEGINPAVFLQWNLNLINKGQTPAYDVVVQARVDILPLPLPVGQNLELEPASPTPPKGPLGPGQTTIASRGLFRMLPTEELSRLRQARDIGFYIYGKATYSDAFGMSHFTEFCRYAAWNSAGAIAMGSLADRHNNSD